MEHLLKIHYQHRLVCNGFNLVDNDAIEAMAQAIDIDTKMLGIPSNFYIEGK